MLLIISGFRDLYSGLSKITTRQTEQNHFLSGTLLVLQSIRPLLIGIYCEVNTSVKLCQVREEATWSLQASKQSLSLLCETNRMLCYFSD